MQKILNKFYITRQEFERMLNYPPCEQAEFLHEMRPLLRCYLMRLSPKYSLTLSNKFLAENLNHLTCFSEDWAQVSVRDETTGDFVNADPMYFDDRHRLQCFVQKIMRKIQARASNPQLAEFCAKFSNNDDDDLCQKVEALLKKECKRIGQHQENIERCMEMIKCLSRQLESDVEKMNAAVARLERTEQLGQKILNDWYRRRLEEETQRLGDDDQLPQ